MITLVIGGQEGCPEVKRVWPDNKRPRILLATQSGSFHRFCAYALESTKVLKHIDHQGKLTHSHLANDDFAVHFSSEYIHKNLSRGTVMFKIATAVETAIDLGLDIEVILVGEEVSEVLKNQWPEHWPERQYLHA